MEESAELSQHDDVLSQNVVFDDKEDDHSVELSQHDDVLSQNVVFDDKEDDHSVELSQHDDVLSQNVVFDDKEDDHSVELSQHDDILSQNVVLIVRRGGSQLPESTNRSSEQQNNKEKDKDWSHLVVFTAHKAVWKRGRNDERGDQSNYLRIEQELEILRKR